MSKIITAHLNILESSTVTLSANTADPDFPLVRIYDRNIGRLFKAASAATTEVKVDQGASGSESVDMLVIPAGHNLDGMTLDIKHSTDDSTYTPAVTQWVQSGDGAIIKTFTEQQARYWKFIVTSPASAPGFAELFLSVRNEWERNPSRPARQLERVFNVTHASTASGSDRFLVHGAAKQRRSYSLPGMGENQKDALLALNEAWAGSNPFWLCDHEGAWIYGRLDSAMEVTEEGYQRYSLGFEFLEVRG